jgi:hypothetical protein
MQTQVSIQVKNESIVSRFFSIMWFINIFKKMSVDAHIDSEGNVQTLKASKEPYLIDLEPGAHQILFTDPRAAGKKAFKAVTGAFMGAAVGGAFGGSMLEGAAWGADGASGGAVKNGIVSFTLRDGDVLRLSAKPKHNGSVKVKILKDK